MSTQQHRRMVSMSEFRKTDTNSSMERLNGGNTANPVFLQVILYYLLQYFSLFRLFCPYSCSTKIITGLDVQLIITFEPPLIISASKN